MKEKSKKMKKLKIICVLLIGFLMISGSVFAEINEEDTITIPGFIQDAINGLSDLTINSSFAGLASLLTTLAAALFLVLQSIFVVGGGGSLMYPFPDQVIFNRIAVLDPNFTSPADYSVVNEIDSLMNSTFLSFQSLAISVFAIIAMVMGIKLAITTVAAEKAKYKQAISKWLMGIIVLFMLRYIIAGSFYLNEEIVKSVSRKANNITFEIEVLEAVPFFGSTLGKIVGKIADAVGADTSVDVNGYFGLVIKSLLEGLGGNIFSSFVAFIILGQSIAIIISYFKRVFYSLLLSIVSPLVVAVDTINKTLGLQSKLLSTWLKEFTITVFIQSLHAFLLVIILQILEEVYETSLTDAVKGIIGIMLTTAIVKFEKVFKGLFGIRTGMMGDIKGGAASAFKAIHGVRQGVGAVADNTKKAQAAMAKKSDADKKINRLDSKIRAAEMARSGITNNISADTDTDTSYGDTNIYGGGPSGLPSGSMIDMEQGEDGVFRPVSASSGALSPGGGLVPGGALASANGYGVGGANVNNVDALAHAIARAIKGGQHPEAARALNVNVTNPDEISSGIAHAAGLSEGSEHNIKTKVPTDEEMEDMYDEMARLQQQKAEAESEFSSARLASIMGAANFVGGIGIGLGAEGNMSDALLTGGYVTKGLDYAAEKIGYQGARKTRKEIYNDTKEKYGIDNEKILQQKSDIIINPMVRAQKGMASALEVKHMIQGTLTQEMSKEMSKEIRKTIREEMKKENSTMSSRVRAHVEDSIKGYKGVAAKHNQFKDSYKSMGTRNNSVDNV